MGQDTVVRFRRKDEIVDPLAQLLRRGARELIGRAVSEEFEMFLQQHGARRDAAGRAAVVRNGYLPEREVLSGIGPVLPGVNYLDLLASIILIGAVGH